MIDIVQAFKGAIRATGLEPPEHIEPERWHRFPGVGKRNGNTAGWCKLFADGMGGIFGDYSAPFTESWQAERERPMTDGERAAFRQLVESTKKQAEEQRRQEKEGAAATARLRWEVAQPANPDHSYLAKKGIQAQGIRQEGDKLIIPMWDEAGQIWALQTIAPDGDKRFSPKNCRTKRLYFIIGQLTPGCFICIVEGFATGVAIYEATGLPVIVAFNAGNLETVAQIIKAKFAGSPIIICADDDQKPDAARNPGIEAATKAALAVGGVVAVPRMNRKADFWDLWDERGSDAVRAVITAAIGAESRHNHPESVDPVAVIQQLAGLSDIEYEQKRQSKAESLGVRVSVLDREVKKAKHGQNENDSPFNEPDPWPVPIKPDQLLSDISATIQRFIVCSKEVAHTAALWSAMTWFIDVVQIAPLAIITAPEKRCGKSQLLFLMGKLSARAISASNISPAALYRAIDAWSPTLLIDEADSFMKDNEELRGIINSGHTRDSAYVIRTVGEAFTPTKFNTWGAKAIAGIGHVADTLMDRAVVLELRRKLPDEEVEKLRYAEPNLFDNLRSKLKRFADDYADQVRQARPPLPSNLNDRAQDNWEPLLAIAMVAGGEWLEIGTAAALKLSWVESASQPIGTELLADIKEIFEMTGADRISTADLIKSLCDDDEKVWSTYNRGNPIIPRQLASKLRGYGISSNSIRIGTSTPKGFMRDQFTEAFSRYLAPPSSLSATPPQPLADVSFGVAVKKTRCGNVADEILYNSLYTRNCCGVADRKYSTSNNKIEVEI